MALMPLFPNGEKGIGVRLSPNSPQKESARTISHHKIILALISNDWKVNLKALSGQHGALP